VKRIFHVLAGTKLNARTKRRAKMVPVISRVTRGREFRRLDVPVDSDGGRTFIPALDDDTVSYVLGRLDDAGGGAVLSTLVDGKPRFVTLKVLEVPEKDAKDEP